MPNKTTRRELLKFGAMAAAGGLRFPEANAMENRQSGEASGWKPGDPVGYINPHIPEFELPPYLGERYEAAVPDTLDLAERARLAINGLTAPTNPLADYEIYPIVSFDTNPPSMKENSWFHQTYGISMEALLLMRLASGSEQNLNVERRWMGTALKIQGPDGLVYSPVKGRPWAFVDWQVRDQGIEKPRNQIFQMYGCGMILNAMALFAARDPGPVWKNAIRRLVDGMAKQVVVEGDYAYCWPSCFITDKNRPSYPPMPTRPLECEGSAIPRGLIMGYRSTHYEPALKLAKLYINYLRKNFYRPDGSWIARPGLPFEVFTHCHARGLFAMEQYAEVTGDKEMMDFVVRSYEHWRACGANFKAGTSDYDWIETPGAGLVGFVVEWMNSPEWQGTETDNIGDMVGVSLWLSEAGVGDYWDDADRIIRNQLAESQLLETDWVYEFSKRGRPPESGTNVTTDRVPERNKGGFSGGQTPNDWGNSGLAICCTANGAKGVGWAWNGILRHNDGQLRVNLLLNRASPWADIFSYIPYQGRVEVKIKKPVDLSMRIPEWVKPAETRCQVNKEERTLGWEGRYAKVGRVNPGDVAMLSFPIFERTDTVWIQKRQYTLLRKGNEVISIDPPGVYHPFYQRQYYRRKEAPMRMVTRFVSDEDTWGVGKISG